MRLLNTSTLTLHSFFGDAVPSYAILSHRWDEEEVSLQDLESGRGQRMPGYTKIERCCAQAKLDGWKYAWIDTCCIDKSSSAELSEAINSMYQWYAKAKVCYAFLGDVSSVDGEDARSDHISRSGSSTGGGLRKSKWFTRGWTLQELLAPLIVVFFNQNWIDIGTKASLEEVISEITGIEDFINFKKACVAQKMSWAARRETTRIEDEAYSLLGLFGVNIPPLYGEGRKAFMRLQLEILKSSDDESIFAWKSHYGDAGPLAPSPTYFSDSGKIRLLLPNSPVRPENNPLRRDGHPFSMTNKGLYISLLLIPWICIPEFAGDVGPRRARTLFVAPLNCCWANTGMRPAISLRQEEDGAQTMSNFYRRDYYNILDSIDPSTVTSWWENHLRSEYSDISWNTHKHIYIKTEPTPEPPPSLGAYPFSINFHSLLEHGFACVDTFEASNISRDKKTKGLINLGDRRPRYTTWVETWGFASPKETVVLVFGMLSHQPWVLVFTPPGDESVEDAQQRIRSISEFLAINKFRDPPHLDSYFMARSSFQSKLPVSRLSRPLNDGKSISASVAIREDREYFIKVTIDPTGKIQWPCAKWLDHLFALAEAEASLVVGCRRKLK